MQAAIYDSFGGSINIEKVVDPSPTSKGVVLKVLATGICRSDWYGWQGHDSDIRLPHVPGHELVGQVVEIGHAVQRWKKDQIVTVPFVGGCGTCPECLSGNQQVCDFQFQPGFTGWGSFAEYVAIDYADENLIQLPDNLSPVHAASLGCRFVTAYRGIVDQGGVNPNDWVAIHGCGGVGLSAILIAKGLGARIIAIDIQDTALALAKTLGADFVLNALHISDIPQAIRDITNRGVQVSVEALGRQETTRNSIGCLAKRGKHIQIGLLEGSHKNIAIPMDQVVAKELEIIGSHGIQSHRYPEIYSFIAKHHLPIEDMVQQTVNLQEGIDILINMDKRPSLGITVIDSIC